MKARIVKIGNSQGIRLSKLLLEHGSDPRQGWDEAARHLASQGDDLLLDDPVSTPFDCDEWDW